MFMYAILILLPALALADDPLTTLEGALLSALDGNKDGKITKMEAENYFMTFDADKDGDITKAEFTMSVDKLDPAFAGHEDALYMLFDQDKSGKVNKVDVDAVFALADADMDGSIEKAEFEKVFNAVIVSVG